MSSFRKMAALCARRELAPNEVREKLHKQKLTSAEIEEVLSALVAQGFIDETRYARAFVHDKMTYNGWGAMKVKQALRLKGIGEEEISKALNEVIADDYNARLEDALRRKNATLKEENPFVRRQKLMRFAANRGYKLSEISEAIDKIGLHEEDLYEEETY